MFEAGDESMTIDLTALWADGFQIFRNIIPTSVVAEVREFLEDELTELAPAFEAMGFRYDAPDAARIIAKILGPAPSLDNPQLAIIIGPFSAEGRFKSKFMENRPVTWNRCLGSRSIGVFASVYAYAADGALCSAEE